MQVHAHPDDEASKGAGTTALYASRGVRCILVTCTGGEAGEILNPAMDRPEVIADIGGVRMRELQRSVEILGYHASHLLGYRDSGMPESEDNKNPAAFANADMDEAVGRLVAIVRADRPQVILTYGEDHSGYPHPDHIRTHEITLQAFDAAADPSRYPDAGEPWQPTKLYYMGWSAKRILALDAAFKELGHESPYGEWARNIGDAEDVFTTRLDVGEFLPKRRAALLAHATQIDPNSHWMTLPDEVVREVYPWEEYILARPQRPAGSPIETDLFEGITA
jgi:mycothiol S-conjugate amidase